MLRIQKTERPLYMRYNWQRFLRCTLMKLWVCCAKEHIVWVRRSIPFVRNTCYLIKSLLSLVHTVHTVHTFSLSIHCECVKCKKFKLKFTIFLSNRQEISSKWKTTNDFLIQSTLIHSILFKVIEKCTCYTLNRVRLMFSFQLNYVENNNICLLSMDYSNNFESK